MRISAHDVARYVADKHSLTFAALISECRQRRIARPRQIAMYAIRKLCPHMSYPAIGSLFGGRDHTTVLHGCRKIEELIAADRLIAEDAAGVIEHFEAMMIADLGPSLSAIEGAMQFQALCNSYSRSMRLAA